MKIRKSRRITANKHVDNSSKVTASYGQTDYSEDLYNILSDDGRDRNILGVTKSGDSYIIDIAGQKAKDFVDFVTDKLYERGFDFDVEDVTNSTIKVFVEENLDNYGMMTAASTKINVKASYDLDDEDDESTSRWVVVKHKMVDDSDGFQTDYTLYENRFHMLGVEDPLGEPNYVCVFGDRDLYDPEDGDWDYECDDEREAIEWFDDYTGFDDDEIDASVDITASSNESDKKDIDDDYVSKLKDSIDAACNGKVSSALVMTDDKENLDLTVNQDENIRNYNIPVDDLTGDIDKDTQYIMGAVKEDYDIDSSESYKDVESSENITCSETYCDPQGMLGESGACYTYEQLQEIFENNKDSDPSMVQYNTFDDWFSGLSEWLSRA